MAPTARNNRHDGRDDLGRTRVDARGQAGNAARREPSRVVRQADARGAAEADSPHISHDQRTVRNSSQENGANPYAPVEGRADARSSAAGRANPYAPAGGRTYARSSAAGRDNPYAPAGSQEPRTTAGPSRTPVPSPPQQNPYLPQSSKGPVLKRRKAKGRVATPASRYGEDAAAGYSAHKPAAGRPGQETPAAPKAPKPRRPRKPATHGCAALLLWLVMLAVVALMGLRLIPANLASGKMVPEAVSFVPLALIPSAVCLVLALLWRRRLLAIVCILALAVNGYWHAGYFVGGTRVSTDAAQSVITSASTSDNAARVMTLNTQNGAASARQIVEVVREQHVEVLCLQELTDGMVSDLEAAGIDELLPYHVVSEGASAISNGGRNGIWTATAQSDVSRNLLPIQTSSMPAASITIGSATVRIVSVHPNSPVRGAQDLWDEGLSTIGTLSDYSHAYLIMGDFNSTWDHARFRELLGTTFADAGQESGQGFHMTYPSNSLIPSLIEIDHIVYSRDSDITVSSLETVTISGTDHQALLGTLEAK